MNGDQNGILDHELARPVSHPRIVVRVSTRHRADDLFDVFAHIGFDDRLHCGIIRRIGKRDWEAAGGLIYGTRGGAAHDLARRAVRELTTDGVLYGRYSFTGEGVR